MKLRIIAAVLLLLFLGLAVLEAGVLRTEYRRAYEQYQSHCIQVQELDENTAELQKKLDSLNFDQAQIQQDQADQLLQEARELSTQMETLRNEIETLKVYLEENQAAAEEALAELEYLQGVYDELEKGLAQVEGYIADN